MIKQQGLHNDQTKPQLFIGIMSGTSLDAVDIVLADCENGVRIIDAQNHELNEAFCSEIRALNSPNKNDLQRSLVLDKKIAYLFSDAVNNLLNKNKLRLIKIMNWQLNNIKLIYAKFQTKRSLMNWPKNYYLNNKKKIELHVMRK